MQKRSGPKASLRISFQITAIVITVFIVASIVSLFSYRRSLDQLAENSKQRVVESVASLVSSRHKCAREWKWRT
ncbi:MAG: hypothetical protein JW738_09225 [Actinobacteria bacterium]|nr:hypothetical protein [Actinomycetota bacterium]